jgi:hypothetical protein
LPDTREGGIVKAVMEIMFKICEKTEGSGHLKPVFTLKTANSACSGCFSARISGIQASPLKYTDPDGRDIVIVAGESIADAINFMYARSNTFRQHINNITKSENALRERLVVLIKSLADEKAGMTKSETGRAVRDVQTLTLNENGEIAGGKISIGEQVQTITINIDLNRLENKNISILEVICEEIMHASDAANMGSDVFTKAVIEQQNSFNYPDQPLESSAKARTSQVLDELIKYNQANQKE